MKHLLDNDRLPWIINAVLFVCLMLFARFFIWRKPKVFIDHGGRAAGYPGQPKGRKSKPKSTSIDDEMAKVLPYSQQREEALRYRRGPDHV